MEKKRKLFSVLEKLFMWLGTPLMIGKTGAYVATQVVERTNDESNENTIGYENIGITYNTKVHSNNFVMLHVSTSDFNDITAMREKLEKCHELGISVGLILDTKAYDLAQIYKDVDYLQAVVKEYNIDLPVYCNIDGVMENKNLNNAQRKEIIEAFVDKANRSDMYLGVYGKDSNLVDCNQYIFDLNDYDCFLVQDKYEIRFDGTYNLMKDMDGIITANLDLSKIITSKGLNSSNKLVYSSSYEVKEGDTYHSLGLQFGLSENDLISYNGGKRELQVGDRILIPNLYKTVDTITNSVTYSYAVARGIDISDYQTIIDWNRVKETSDYVIVEVARDSKNYLENKGNYLTSAANQIENALNNNISLGLYFCVSEGMEVSIYEERLGNYLSRLDKDLANKSVTLVKENIPVFLDFEVYCSFNDYYQLMSSFERICNEHGYKRIGIYGNGYTLDQINSSLKREGESINLNETNWYVWKSGGPQYSGRENTSYDDVKLEELLEIESDSEKGYTPIMQQVTNVCTDTGAANTAGHCDVSFLYDYSVFGEQLLKKMDNDETYAGTIEIDLANYPNLPVQKVAGYADLLLSCVYGVVAIKVVGKKLYLALKNKCNAKKLVK